MFEKRGLIFILLLVLCSSFVLAVECGPNPTTECEVTVSTTFNNSNPPIYLSGSPAIHINADNLILDCNNSIIVCDSDCIHNSGSNITIKNCILNLSENYANYFGIYDYGNNNLRIENNTIYAAGGNGIWLNDGGDNITILYNGIYNIFRGILASDISDISIMNNTIKDASYDGIDFFYSENIFCNNNTISNTTRGLFFKNVTNAFVSNNNINNSRLYNGIQLEYSDNLTIENNNIYNSIDHGIWVHDCTYITISNNNIFNSFYEGIGIMANSNNVAIEKNTIFSSGNDGIWFDSISDLDISNNEIYGISVWNGIGGANSNHILVNNNIIYNTTTLLWIGTSSDITISNNQFYNNTDAYYSGIAFTNPENLLIENNTFSNIQASGIWMDGGANIHVLNNNFENIVLYNALSGWYFNNLTLENNKMYNSGGGLFWTQNSSNIQILNNTLQDTYTYGGIELVNSENISIKDNNIENVTLWGINVGNSLGLINITENNLVSTEGLYIFDSNNLYVTGNIIDKGSNYAGNGGLGILLERTENAYVNYNNIQHQCFGFNLYTSNNSVWENNYIANMTVSTLGACSDDNVAVLLKDGSHNNIFRDNILLLTKSTTGADKAFSFYDGDASYNLVENNTFYYYNCSTLSSYFFSNVTGEGNYVEENCHNYNMTSYPEFSDINHGDTITAGEENVIINWTEITGINFGYVFSYFNNDTWTHITNITENEYSWDVSELVPGEYKIRIQGRTYIEYTKLTEINITLNESSRLTVKAIAGLNPLQNQSVHLYTESMTYFGEAFTNNNGNAFYYNLSDNSYKAKTYYQGKWFWSPVIYYPSESLALINITLTSVNLYVTLDDEILSNQEVHCYTDTNYYIGNKFTNENGQTIWNFSEGDYKCKTFYQQQWLWTNEFSVPETTNLTLQINRYPFYVSVSLDNSPLLNHIVHLYAPSPTQYIGPANTNDSGTATFNVIPGNYAAKTFYRAKDYWSNITNSSLEDNTLINIPLADVNVYVYANDAPVVNQTVHCYTGTNYYIGWNVTDIDGKSLWKMTYESNKCKTYYNSTWYWESDFTVPDVTNVSIVL